MCAVRSVSNTSGIPYSFTNTTPVPWSRSVTGNGAEPVRNTAAGSGGAVAASGMKTSWARPPNQA